MATVLRLIPGSVNRTAVEVLEEALAAARSGDVVSVAIATVTSDASSVTYQSTAPNAITLLGGVTRLQHQIQLALDKGK